jgi:mannan endo-1,4-beta-mannosidase
MASTSILRISAAIVMLTGLFIAQGGATSPARADSSQIALGAYVPLSPRVSYAPLDTYAAMVGHMPAIVWGVEYWGDPQRSGFPTQTIENFDQRGIMPMINWQPSIAESSVNPVQPQYSWTSIASGKYDAYVRAWAIDAKANGHPLYVRLMHEMNGNWYPWGYHINGNTDPADFVRAWRHIVDIFRAVGANNVGFVWCVDARTWTPADKALYPGDDYVDWVAIDGYNSDRPWIDLYRRFNPSYTDLTALSTKPFMIAEIGSVENPRPTGQTKADWIKQGLLQEIPQSFPRVRAVIWFDSNQGADRNWTVDSSPASLAAFKQVVADPYYQASMPPPANSVGATAQPTATPTPTPRPAIPTKFTITSVRLQPNTKPNWRAHVQGLAQVHVHKTVVVAAYFVVQQVREPGKLSVSFTVKHGTHMVTKHHATITVPKAGKYWTHWNEKFTVSGTYSLKVVAHLTSVGHSRRTRFTVKS